MQDISLHSDKVVQTYTKSGPKSPQNPNILFHVLAIIFIFLLFPLKGQRFLGGQEGIVKSFHPSSTVSR